MLDEPEKVPGTVPQLELGLDWDAPPLPPAPATAAEPLQFQVESGNLLPRTQADQLVQQANQHFQNQKHAEGLAALRQAVKVDPTHALAHHNLAWRLLVGPKELQDQKEALVHARKAVELSPLPFYPNTLGLALSRNDEFAEAVPILEKNLKDRRGWVDAGDLFTLAICHHRLGNAAKAKDCYEQAAQWFQERRNKLPAEWVEKLTALQDEANAVLREPPAGKREDR